MSRTSSVIVVGVAPGEPDAVVNAVVDLAVDLGAEVVFAYVDPTQYVAHERSGATHLAPIDPDLVDDGPAADVVALEGHLDQLVEGRLAHWRLEHLAGDPSRELARLAEDVRARLIVVGTRRPGRRHRMGEFFTGSIAVQLAHHQHRPVLVVPTTPVTFEEAAPWE